MKPATTTERVLAAQLKRPLSHPGRPIARCAWKLPVVVETPPVGPRGEPFPTRYWLTCPAARHRISTLEAAGAVRMMHARVQADPQLARSLEQAHQRYTAERDRLVEPGQRRPAPGVGGSQTGIKCLHAHYADTCAGNLNPIGQWVRKQVEPIECEHPCVRTEPDGVERPNPAWRTPR